MKTSHSKQKLIDAYKDMGCAICGYNKVRRSLHFHHIDPQEKEQNISQAKNKMSKKDLANEMGKCIVLCANCHGEVHAGLIDLNDLGVDNVDAYDNINRRFMVEKATDDEERSKIRAMKDVSVIEKRNKIIKSALFFDVHPNDIAMILNIPDRTMRKIREKGLDN